MDQVLESDRRLAVLGLGVAVEVDHRLRVLPPASIWVAPGADNPGRSPLPLRLSRGRDDAGGRGAYIYFQQHHEPPPYQQQFTSIVYSLENSVPVLRLWQDSAWTPDPAALSSAHWWVSWPTSLRLFRRIENVCGWILVTLFLAGVTGIVRRE